MFNRNKVFAAACLGLFLFGMTLITLGSILPSLVIKFEDAKLSSGILVSILPIGILAGSLVFGPIVDRYGFKLLLIASVLVSAIALEGLAFSNSVTLLYSCIFLIGFGGGIINGGTSALVADISSENKEANLSLLGVFFGLGALGMPLLLGLLSKRFEFEKTLAAVGFFMLLVVAYLLVTRFPNPKQAQGFPLKQGIKLLKEPALLLTAFFLFFQSGVEALVNNWTTSFLQFRLNIQMYEALYALSLSLLGLTLTRLLLGALLRNISSIFIMLISLLIVAAGALILISTHSYLFSVISLIIIGTGLAAGFPVMLGYAGQLYANLSGTAFSIALVIALTGNTILNYLFSQIAAKYSIGYLPFLLLGCILCMLVLLWLIKRVIGPKIRL